MPSTHTVDDALRDTISPTKLRASTSSGKLLRAAVALLLLGGGCKETQQQPTKTEPSAVTKPPLEERPEAPPAAPPCPDDMAPVGGYCVDRYEAHLVLADAPDVVLPHFEPLKRGTKAMARSRADVAPQAYLNRAEAARACKLAKKRLCRAREWYGACGGRGKTRYPYGDSEIARSCNTGKVHLMQRLFGADVKYTYSAHYNSPRLHQEPGFLAKSGEYSSCVNDYGIYDMVGNLHEWVADDVSKRLVDEVPIEYGPDMLGAKGSGVFMGGYFSSHGEHGRGCAYVTATHSPDYHDYSIGFRCCADARSQSAAAGDGGIAAP